MEFQRNVPRGEDSKQTATDLSTMSTSGVARLVVNINGRLDRCTGFLVRVDGQFIILTDANNLYNRLTGKAEEVTVFLGGNGEDPNGCVIRKKKSEFEVPEDHKTGLTEFDIGVIFLRREDYYFPDLSFFTLCYPTSNTLETSTLYMSGYQVEEDTRVIPKTMKVMQDRSDEVFLYYKCASATGNPGWPIYFLKEKTPLAIGIHTEGYNKATLFSKRIVSSIQTMVQEPDDLDYDRLAYQEQRQRPQLHRWKSEVSINITCEPKDTFQRCDKNRRTLPAKWGSDYYHDNTGTILNESSSRVTNKKDLPPDSMKINIEVRIPSTSSEVSPLSPQNDDYQPFGRSSPVKSEDSTKVWKFQGGRKCIWLPPSNLLFEPRVIQPYDSFKSMEHDFIRQDMLNIFPSKCLADSSIQAKLVDTLRQITSSGVVLVTSSLVQLLHISFCEDQPRNILFEMFGAIPKLPPFVLTITDTNTHDTNVNDYTRHLNQQVIHTVRMFTDEKISSIYGTIEPKDFQTREAFRAALSSLRATSCIFCNPILLSMDIKRSHNVSRSCLLAMAVSSNIPTTIKDVEVTLGSKENLLDHWETMTSKLKSRLDKTGLEKDVKTTLTRTSSSFDSDAMREGKQTIAVYPMQRNSPKSPEYSRQTESEDSANIRSEPGTNQMSGASGGHVDGSTKSGNISQGIHPAASSTQSATGQPLNRHKVSSGQEEVVSTFGSVQGSFKRLKKGNVADKISLFAEKKF